MIDYDELSDGERAAVRAHVAGCGACREYLEALKGIDAQLSRLYAEARVSPEFERAVAIRVGTGVTFPKPSFVPEVLDFFGWTAVIAFVACATLLFVPIWAFRPIAAELFTLALIGVPAMAVSAAVWIGWRSYAELRR